MRPRCAVWMPLVDGCAGRRAQGRVRPVKIDDDVRTHHDEWIKEALGLWLGGLGDIVADARIAGRSRRGDIVYTERRDDPALRGRLGALGELARGKVLFEVFRNALGALELKICVTKLVELEAAAARAARRDARKLSTIVVPTLCVVVPSISREFRDAMGIKAVSPDAEGLYTLLGAGWHTVIVVANELPRSVSTMWLRLLGRGKVQAGAVRQLLETSRQEPLRDATVKLLEEWRQSLPPAEDLGEDVKELVMNLGQSFESWEDETLARGMAKGRAEGRAEGEAKGKAEGKAEAVLAVLGARGLHVTAAQRKQVLACASGALLDAWLRAAVTTESVKALLSAGTPQRSRGKRG